MNLFQESREIDSQHCGGGADFQPIYMFCSMR